MTAPRVVSRDEWIAARTNLLEQEKALTRERDRVNAERRALPMVRIDKDYIFHGPNGPVSLLDLFEDRKQLIVYHFMFHPDWDDGCPSCSLMVDGAPHLSHLHAVNTSLVLVSRAPYHKLAAFKRRMGWDIPWYSSFDSDFNHDFHVTLDPTRGPVEYNYQVREVTEAEKSQFPPGGAEAPGTSVFYRDGVEIFHTYSSYARGGDILLTTFNFLDLTPLGRQEEGGIMNWVRLHDQYETERSTAPAGS